jgi:hypothetical protein
MQTELAMLDLSKLQKEEQFIPLAHKCMTAHFYGLIQALP